MPMIRETIVTTVSGDGRCISRRSASSPTATAGSSRRFGRRLRSRICSAVPFAVANYTDDVRIFAGCLTGRHDWPTTAADDVPVPRLAAALAHAELAVARCERRTSSGRAFIAACVHRASHAPFEGFNRAKAAVIEAAILVSRLDMLPRREDRGGDRLSCQRGEKTAGAAEAQAWAWLNEAIRAHYAGKAAGSPSRM